MEQRRDLGAYADGLRQWLRGEDTQEADAAGRNVANVLVMFRHFMGGEGD